MKTEIINEHFWSPAIGDDTTLLSSELGLIASLSEEALSDNPETIFRHVIEVVGLNIVFYWVRDQNFYVIETEKSPIEVRRLPIDPNWDGKYEFYKVGEYGPISCLNGEILATFDEPTDIWNELKIDDVSISEVLEQSLIVTWD